METEAEKNNLATYLAARLQRCVIKKHSSNRMG